jgi:Tol biopolymer transport system component
VAFSSNRSGSPEVWVCDSEGQNPVQVTSFGGPSTGSPCWSPDNEHVAFESTAPGHRAVYLASVADGREPRPLTKGRDDQRFPSWSHDRRWVYFSANRGGVNQICKVQAQGGQEVQQTSKRGGERAVESAGGKWVYYYARAEVPGIWRVPAEGGEEELVLALPAKSSSNDWSLAEQGIYYLEKAATPGPVIWFFDFASGQRTRVAQLDDPAPERILGLTVSPDGQWFLYERSYWTEDIMLVENFR